jgi:hypothetical protein
VVPRRGTFGRGFDSRRLHQLSGVFRAFQPEIPAASPLAPRLPGSLHSSNRIAASNAAGLRCMYRCVVPRSRCPASSRMRARVRLLNTIREAEAALLEAKAVNLPVLVPADKPAAPYHHRLSRPCATRKQ